MAGVSRSSSGGATAFPLPYQNGNVIRIRKITIPAMIFPRVIDVSSSLLSFRGSPRRSVVLSFSPFITRALPTKLVDARHRHAGDPVVHERRQGRRGRWRRCRPGGSRRASRSRTSRRWPGASRRAAASPCSRRCRAPPRCRSRRSSRGSCSRASRRNGWQACRMT